MLHKGARYICALALALSLSPVAAFAATADSQTEASAGGYVVAQVIQTMDATAATLYTDALTPPDNVITGTVTTMPGSGILRGSDGVLYYLRETPTSGGGFTFYTLEGYNVSTGTWSTLSPMPQRLAYCSATMWNGRLVVCGAASGATEASVYLYSPDSNSWVELDAQGVPVGSSIVYNGFGLFLVGGAFGGVGTGTTVYAYDVETGLGDIVATLATPVFCPELAAHDGDLYVYSYGDSVADWTSSSAVNQHLQVVKDGATTDLSSALPAFNPAVATGNLRSQLFGSLAADIEGLIIVGPSNAADTADTYVMSWNGSGTFAEYARRASDQQLYGTAACVYGSKLYAAGANLDTSTSQASQVFRATDVEAPAVVTGNYAVWRKGSTSPLTLTFSPDISRFANKVLVDGVQVPTGDYAVAVGSTQIDVSAQFLQNLSVGQHEMVTYFDGGGVGVTTYFTVENEADSIASADGRTRPAALAMTGDAMLVVPFAVVGVGAIALAVYLLRRKSRTI